MSWVSDRPDLPVLLVHGDTDELVPLTFTQQFAAALRSSGHDVRVEIVQGAGHADLYSARVMAPLIAAWMHSVLATPTSAPSGAPG
jgi:predicted esterase